MADINALLASLDPETLKALQNANSDDLKKALDDTKKEDEKKTGPFLSTVKTIEPRFYHITIKPEDWKKLDTWFYNCEVNNKNDQQLREASIISLSFDENKMRELNEKDGVDAFIDRIYDEGLIRIKAKNLEGDFFYEGKERPEYIICLIIEELPFLDTPASEFGL